MVENIIKFYLFIQFIFLYIMYSLFPHDFTDKKLTEETIEKYKEL